MDEAKMTGRKKNWLFSDTPKGAEASAVIYSIVVTAKLNGLNQRVYLEWLLTEMSNDKQLLQPGRIDRYLSCLTMCLQAVCSQAER